jgi:hypothetical protein
LANDFTNSHAGGNVIRYPPKAGLPPCQTRHRLPNMPEKIWLIVGKLLVDVVKYRCGDAGVVLAQRPGWAYASERIFR